MPKPKLVGVSKEAIVMNVARFFISHLHLRPDQFDIETDVKTLLNYGEPEWAALALPLSDQNWMRAINVTIVGGEMKNRHSAWALGERIWARVMKLVYVHVSDKDLPNLGFEPYANPSASKPARRVTKKRSVKKAAAKKTAAKKTAKRRNG